MSPRVTPARWTEHTATALSSTFRYRVKPEVQYRPHTAEEAVRRLIGKTLYWNPRSYRTELNNISHVVKSVSVDMVYYTDGGFDYLGEGLVENYSLADGSRCGMPVEEASGS